MIKEILENKKDLVLLRWNSLFKPAAAEWENTDYFNYFLSPFLDLALEPIHLIDLIINIINLIFSLLKVGYYYSMAANGRDGGRVDEKVEELERSAYQTLWNLAALLIVLISVLRWVMSSPFNSDSEPRYNENYESEAGVTAVLRPSTDHTEHHHGHSSRYHSHD